MLLLKLILKKFQTKSGKKLLKDLQELLASRKEREDNETILLASIYGISALSYDYNNVKNIFPSDSSGSWIGSSCASHGCGSGGSGGSSDGGGCGGGGCGGCGGGD